MPEFDNRAFFDDFSMYMFKADLLRYELLYRFGGIYIDTDVLFFKNIEPLLNGSYFLCREKSNRNSVSNAILGFEPKHYVMEYVVSKIPESMQQFREMRQQDTEHKAGLKCIGPSFLAKSINAVMPEAFVYGAAYFYPFNSVEMKKQQLQTFPKAYGAHFWNYTVGPSNLEIHKTLPCYKRSMAAL